MKILTMLRVLSAAVIACSCTGIAWASDVGKELKPLPDTGRFELVCKFYDTSVGNITESIFESDTNGDIYMVVAGQKIIVRPIMKMLDKNTEEPDAVFEPHDQGGNKADLSTLAGLSTIDTGKGNKNKHVIANQLLRDGLVEYCDFMPMDVPPPIDIPPLTPDLSGGQGYFDADPGIDVNYAHSINIRGANVTIADAEFDWELEHEDLAESNIVFGTPRGRDDYTSHGTSVVGIWAAGHNGYGVNGTLPDARVRVYTEGVIDGGPLGGRVYALVSAVADLQVGDVLVLEMQTYTGFPSGEDFTGLGPADYELPVWDVVKTATDAGIHVVAAAGNGNMDLDDAYYDDYRARGDNGSIIVGAGTSDTAHDKLFFSTFGSPVHLQAWGHNVATLAVNPGGYGNDPRQAYTTAFSGTSSATPLVATAVALAQDYAEQNLGRNIAPREMRELLIATGVPQGAGGHIGPMPDIRRAIEALDPSVGPQYYFIVNKKSGLNIHSCESSTGAPVRGQTLAGNCSRWEKVANGDYFHLKNKHTGLFMRPGQLDDGADVKVAPNTWTGNWTQWSDESLDDGYVYLKHKQSGKYIRPATDVVGTVIQLRPTTWTGSWTRWKFLPVD